VNRFAEPEVVRLARQFRAELASADERQLRLMAARYLDVADALQDGIESLALSIEELRAEGKAVAIGRIYRLERYQRLLGQLMRELSRFNGWALAIINTRQRELIVQGAEDASSLLRAGQPGITVRFDALHREAIEAMVGIAREGTPLAALLDASYGETTAAIHRTLASSIGLGRGPRQTARLLTKNCQLPLQRALRIARTEQLRAYRLATLDTYRSAGVALYQRVAARDPNTCIACLSMDGTIYSTETSLDDHVNGRCSIVPLFSAAEAYAAGAAQEWFDAQDRDMQLQIMGPARLELYRSGRVDWSELAVRKDDPIWGGAWVPTPVSVLRTAGGTPAMRAA